MRGETLNLTRKSTPSESFQSTPLMRGETYPVLWSVLLYQHFNPLPSCEGRRTMTPSCVWLTTFQSTPLMRGETRSSQTFMHCIAISIHSPHARGDDFALQMAYHEYISIHSPHARGDQPDFGGIMDIVISIHSPHARGDSRRS